MAVSSGDNYAWAPGKLVALVGVEGLIVVDTPDALLVATKDHAEEVKEVVDRLRNAGILVGRTGPDGNVLKIRPPLVFGDEHAELLVDALRHSL